MARKKKIEETKNQEKTKKDNPNQEYFITWNANQAQYIFSPTQKYFPNRTNISVLSQLYSELMAVNLKMVEDLKTVNDEYFKKEDDIEKTLKDFAICRFVKNTEDFEDIFAWFDKKMNFHPIDSSFDETKDIEQLVEKYDLYFFKNGKDLPRLSLSQILGLDQNQTKEEDK